MDKYFITGKFRPKSLNMETITKTTVYLDILKIFRKLAHQMLLK